MIKIYSIEIQKKKNPDFSPTVWKDSKPDQIPQLRFVSIPNPNFSRLFGKTPNQVRFPPIEICVNPKSQFPPDCLERLQTGLDSPQLRFV